MQDLALQAVRKPKAKKTHLTVPARPDTDIRTLCGVEMKAGDYELVEDDADCQPCLRKKGNRAFISSAYFAGDAGARLLELSVKQAQAGRPQRKPPPAPPPRPRVVGRKERPEPGPTLEQLDDLGLRHLEPAGPQVYRSKAGVLVRLRQAGRDWEIAEVTFDGPARVTHSRRGTSVKLGDFELEV